MKALVSPGKGKAEMADVPIPTLTERLNYVLVRVKYVALNPADWKGYMNNDRPGCIMGNDFSGIVEEVGPGVKTKVAKGDKVGGFTYGFNKLHPDSGTFAEYCLVKDGMFVTVPDSLSLEEASTLGVAITTVGQGLYQSLQLPWPSSPAKEPFPLLVYGGSTAMGTLAIEFAKLSGLEVIATSRAHNFELVKSFGADAVFDYTDPDVGAQIRAHTGNRLHHVFDCVGSGSSSAISAAALSSDVSPENQYSTLMPVGEIPRPGVSARSTIAYTAFGELIDLGFRQIPPMPGHYEHSKKMWATAQELLEHGKLKAHPVEMRSGGLSAIVDGLADLQNGKVSGKKLVYQVS